MQSFIKKLRNWKSISFKLYLIGLYFFLDRWYESIKIDQLKIYTWVIAYINFDIFDIISILNLLILI